MTGMRTAVLTDNREFSIEERPVPSPGPDEVLVAIEHVGICGSDVHFYKEGHIGEVRVEYPFVLGHESAGHIVETGVDVTEFDPDDPVAIEPGVPCGRCRFCRAGDYELCPRIEFMASPPDDGALTEYVSWPAEFVYPLPERMSTREAALCEPLSCGIHTVRMGGVGMGDAVLVTGSGPIGILALAAADAAGASDLLITGRHDEKLAVAEALGADRTINVREEAAMDVIESYTDGDGVDVAIDASGAPSAIDTAIQGVRAGGTVVLYGFSSELTVSFDAVEAIRNELTIQGAFRYANTYDDAISLVAAGDIDVGSIIDFEMPLAAVGPAFERVIEDDVVKGMISLDR